MSAVAPILPADAAPAPAPKRQQTLRWLGRNSWAFADQALISTTNFATGVLTARALHQAEFGTFANIYIVLLWCNIFQSTLVTQAHNVIGSTRDGRDYRRYTTSTALAQLVIVALEVLLTMPFALLGSIKGWAAAGMLWALIPSIIFWQFQEFIRRVLYTEGRYGAAFANDIISYGGQTVLLAALFVGHRKGVTQLTGAEALWALALTSAVAAAIGVWQIRRSLAWELDHHAVAVNWHFGKWLVGGELMSWFTSLPMQMWWAALIVGTAASADLRAAQILFGPTRVIAFFLGTVLPIRFARALHKDGVSALHARVRSLYGYIIPVVGVYCMFLALFPRPLLHLIYGHEYSSPETVRVLVLYSISAFIAYMQMVIAAALTAARQTRYIFAGSAVGCAAAVVLSPICIHQFGAAGAILSMIATTLIVTVLYCMAYRKQIAGQLAGAFSDVSPSGVSPIAEEPA